MSARLLSSTSHGSELPAGSTHSQETSVISESGQENVGEYDGVRVNVGAPKKKEVLQLELRQQLQLQEHFERVAEMQRAK